MCCRNYDIPDSVPGPSSARRTVAPGWRAGFGRPEARFPQGRFSPGTEPRACAGRSARSSAPTPPLPTTTVTGIGAGPAARRRQNYSCGRPAHGSTAPVTDGSFPSLLSGVPPMADWHRPASASPGASPAPSIPITLPAFHAKNHCVIAATGPEWWKPAPRLR